jgi:cytochrome c-type biogenesis protein CcmH
VTLLFFAALLTLAVLAALILPLRRLHAPPPPADHFNAAVYRQQLKELDAEVGREIMPDSEAAGARLEIERRLLAAARRDKAGDTTPSRAPLWATVAVAGVIIVGGAGLYLLLGKPNTPDNPFSGDRQAIFNNPQGQAAPGAGAVAAAGSPGGERTELEQLMAQLKAKMQAEPGDPKGWVMLGNGLLRLDRPLEAVDAYRHALDLGVTDPEVLADAGEARVAATAGAIDKDAQALFKRAAAADPKAAKPRYYLALAKMQAGDKAGALAGWRALAAEAPADAPYLPAVRARIADAERPAGAATAAPPGDQAAAIAALPEGEQRAMINAMVQNLADRLKANPKDVDGWRRLARAYTVLDRRPEAADAWRKVLALDPADADAKAALGR